MATHYFKVETDAELKKIVKAFETLFGESILYVHRGNYHDLASGDPVNISMTTHKVTLPNRGKRAAIDLGYEGIVTVSMDDLVRGSEELMLISKA